MGSKPTQAPSQITAETLPVAHTLKVQQNWKNFSEKSVSIWGETVHASHNWLSLYFYMKYIQWIISVINQIHRRNSVRSAVLPGFCGEGYTLRYKWCMATGERSHQSPQNEQGSSWRSSADGRRICADHCWRGRSYNYVKSIIMYVAANCFHVNSQCVLMHNTSMPQFMQWYGPQTLIPLWDKSGN